MYNAVMESVAKTFLYNGIKIKYDEISNGDLPAGKAGPILLLHGFGVSSYSWHNISKPLSQKNKLFLIDLKGFGLSDKPLDNKYSIGNQVEIIVNFIQKNNLQNLILIGHSMGGTVALQTVLQCIKTGNNFLKGLILIDSPAYKQRLPLFIQILRIPVLNKLIFSFLPAKLCTKLLLKKCFFDDTKITDEMIENYSRFFNMSGSSHALIATAKKLIPKNTDDITSKYKEIKIPTLIIWGEDDKIVPLSIGQCLEQEIPNSKLAIIPDCGHMPQEEKPEETAEIISDFLKNI